MHGRPYSLCCQLCGLACKLQRTAANTTHTHRSANLLWKLVNKLFYQPTFLFKLKVCWWILPTGFCLKWLQRYDKIHVRPLASDNAAHKRLIIQELIWQRFLTLRLCQTSDSLPRRSLPLLSLISYCTQDGKGALNTPIHNRAHTHTTVHVHTHFHTHHLINANTTLVRSLYVINWIKFHWLSTVIS